MSRRSIGRNIMDEKLSGVQDAALRLTLLMKSPYRKHLKQARQMSEMVNKMQTLVADATTTNQPEVAHV